MKATAGISTGCWYPVVTETIPEKISRTGYKTAEVFLCDESECGTEYLKELRRRFDSFGIKVVSLHPFTSFAEPQLFFSDYGRRTENAFGLYKKYWEASSVLGASFVSFHGAVQPVETGRYAEIYHRLYLDAKASGVTFCQENVRKHLSGKIEFLTEIKHLLGNEIAFTLDFKQANIEAQDISGMIDDLAENIALVHLSDSRPGEPCLLPGDGTADLGAYIKRLSEKGYNGAYITEVYSRNYADESRIAASCVCVNDIIRMVYL